MDAIYLIIYFALFFMSVVAHEVAHGWAALKLGDTTARDMGRLTFEPTCHIDPVMTIIVPLVLYFTSGMIFGGAKPVPINPYKFRNPDRGMAITSLAGPLTNITIAVVFSIFYIIAVSIKVAGNPLSVIQGVIMINLFLAFFNLIPIPPLDGSRIFRLVLPPAARANYDRIERFGMIILLLFLFTLGNYVFPYFFSFINWYIKTITPTF